MLINASADFFYVLIDELNFIQNHCQILPQALSTNTQKKSRCTVMKFLCRFQIILFEVKQVYFFWHPLATSSPSSTLRCCSEREREKARSRVSHKRKFLFEQRRRKVFLISTLQHLPIISSYHTIIKDPHDVENFSLLFVFAWNFFFHSRNNFWCCCCSMREKYRERSGFIKN